MDVWTSQQTSECRLAFAISLMLLTIVAPGCDTEHFGMVNVTGVVSCDGTPVDRGNIAFAPKAGGRPSMGEIQSDGTYSLSTYKRNDGAMAGDYLVTIKVVEVEGEVAEGHPPKFVWITPERYASSMTSDLTATIAEGKRSQEIDFDLPSE